MMRDLPSRWLLIGLFALLPGIAQGQTAHGFFTTTVTAGAGTGGADQVAITVQLRADPSTDLGSATLRLRYDAAALALPSGAQPNTALAENTDFVFHDYHEQYLISSDPVEVADYTQSTVTRPQPSELSVNLVLGSTGIGKPLPETLTDVLTLTFDLIDPQAAQQAEVFGWAASGIEIFAEDNITAFTLGTFGGDLGDLSVGAERLATDVPTAFALAPNYPNPFNPTTTFHYDLPAATAVTLTLFDVLGRRVATLVQQQQPAGTYRVSFDASALAGGVYFYQLQAGAHTVTRQMVLLK